MTLTIQDLGALGELLGSVAVLATLVYLAMQTRQNTTAIAAQVEAARTSSLMNLGLNLVQPGTVEAFVEDMAEESTINDFRRAVSCQLMLQNLEWQFDQARRGVMPGFSADRVGGTVGSYFTMFRSFGGIWESQKTNYGPEFVEWVEEQRSKAA